jgi:hypothetical protein
MFLLVDVQSMIAKVLKSRSIAVRVALTSILDDFFLRSFANSRERRIQPIRVALKREMNSSVCFVLCGSRKIVLYRLLHNRGPETYP